MTSQPNQLLVLGATGFTGRLVTKYLASHPSRSTFSLQLGGRSASKLAALVKEFDVQDAKIVSVDVTDAEQVEQAVKGANVVLNCAGPFFYYGTPVVAACARNGVNYADITGESHWIQSIIEQYDYQAFKNHATIIPAAAFDSVPADLSAFLGVQNIKSLLGPTAQAGKSVTAHKIKGGISGGTYATVLSLFEDVPREQIKKSSRPFALSPVQGPAPSFPHLIYTLPQLTYKPVYGSFFVMSGINTNIVRRTWGLLQAQPIGQLTHPKPSIAGKKEDKGENLAYGDKFDYDEFVVMPSKLWAAGVSTALFVAGILLFVFPPARWLFKALIPQPGQGPAAETLEDGFWEGTNITSSVPTPEYPETRHVKTVIKGRGDFGYLLASVFVSETALSLLPANREALTALGREGGILTPMSAIGETLVERLKASGRFEIESGEVVDGGKTEGKKIR